MGAVSETAIDYGLVLSICNASTDPAGALRAFVEQEREDAAYNASRPCA